MSARESYWLRMDCYHLSTVFYMRMYRSSCSASDGAVVAAAAAGRQLNREKEIDFFLFQFSYSFRVSSLRFWCSFDDGLGSNCVNSTRIHTNAFVDRFEFEKHFLEFQPTNNNNKKKEL